MAGKLRCDKCRAKTNEHWFVDGQWLCVNCYQAYKLQDRETELDASYDADVFRREQERRERGW